MPTRFRFIFSALLLAITVLSSAQNPAPDIRPMLKSLTKDQKLQFLEYLRYLGAGMDEEIQHTYTLVSRENQAQAIRFIETLKEAKEGLPGTSVLWDRDTIYFGNILEGTSVIDSFEVTNIGDNPYVLSSTKSTCDCTVLKFPGHPVMPGETAIVRVEFDTRGKRGAAIPAIIVYDNSSPNKRNILYLKGDISPRKRLRKNPWED